VVGLEEKNTLKFEFGKKTLLISADFVFNFRLLSTSFFWKTVFDDGEFENLPYINEITTPPGTTEIPFKDGKFRD
jgi:hypothetical protein